MFFKKACFVVLLVLLAQIIVMRKLNRNKDKKQPKASYRGYARKYAKASSVVPTPTFQPKFQARAIVPEVLSSINSTTTKKTTSIKKTMKENTKTTTAKASKVTTKSKVPEIKESIVKSKTSSKSKPTSTISSKTKVKRNTSSESTKQSTIKSNASSISTSSKAKPTTTEQKKKTTSSSIPTSSTTSASSVSSTLSSSSATVTNSKADTTASVMVSKEVIMDTPAMTKPHKENVPKSCYRKGKVSFTQYWIPIENQWDEDNYGQRVFLGGNEKVDLLDKNGASLAIVPVEMYRKCKMEGTCLLENGDIINIDNTTNSFLRVGTQGRENNIFGLGSGEQNLVPFVSVASNDLPYGQKLYIKQLDGLDLGKGRVHNGCVRVDDDSWSFKGCQIDLFVLTYVDYLWLDLDIDRIKVQFIDCELKNYVLKEDMETVKATNKEEIIPSLLYAKYVEYK